ncbi:MULTISPECIES: DNA-formamidopyrimidine glycosylase family protein [unclassified Cryobacterium]|uniref:DNA-formamidopyrimidine glycosylase family protein n=1 Tax=unclassified Cryobacterium TaxID=2649013 RepID=UPI00106A8FC2|nr:MULTISPECIES: DNA-formamidopyrimidine glycosylase family protein [unclassified Cryobacterium]TFC54912.1 Fpg/Nei family DNA glycosylase [Cryobacterium sp. TMB3-1-2]TFC70407.1 Fpg/Nei family DNA glycosylase [Cryobacterium sp. TMB3-15]TFC75748.1 Fpg/Nei family DNA glycosylase [Cryobacterium sp. TMB3-10]TFD37700.1 Fpg/Nei family DNA glycosylase [Cryobacterium sp. TMB3-12]
MPEGDTVYRSARSLDDALHGATLTRCDIRVPAFATVDLTGQTVHEVISRGKHLVAHVGETSIHSHLKMEGTWHLYRHGTKWQRPAFQARIVLETADWVAVGFELGTLELFPTPEDEQHLGYLGPDLLGPNWDAAEAVRRLRAAGDSTAGDRTAGDSTAEDSAAGDRPVAVALGDQRNLAGLGNVYVNELCFLRGLLPTRPIAEVTDVAGLVALAHRLIMANRDRSERTTTGNLRRGARTFVYGRERQPCRRCGTSIRSGRLGRSELEQRVTYWCPRCQT